MRRSDEDKSPAGRHRRVGRRARCDHRRRDPRAKIAGDAETAGTFEAALQSAQVFLAGRERAKTNIVRVINEARVGALRARQPLRRTRASSTIPEKLFMLTDDELDAMPGRARVVHSHVIEERWAISTGSLFEREPVFVVNGRVPGLDEMGTRAETATPPSRRSPSGDVLTGAAGCRWCGHRPSAGDPRRG